MPIAFLAPLALAATALAALPVAIHMLRRAKARQVEFPSLRFLRETPALARSFAAPHDRWLLLLRVAIVLAAALAMSRPVWVGGPGAVALARERAVVVLVDASASMTRPGAREQALEAARAAIARLDPSDRVAAASFDASVRWLTQLVEPDAASAALDRYSPGYAAANVAAAIREAEKLLADAPQANRRIVLVSDFQSANGPWETPSLDGSIALEGVRVGGEMASAFVTGVDVERGADGDVARVGLVEERDGERRVAVVTVPLAAGAVASGVRIEQVEGGWRAVASAPDDLDVDDARYFVAPPPLSIAVVDRGPATPYLAAAAEASFPGARVTTSAAVANAGLEGANRALVTQRALAAVGGLDALEAWVRSGNEAVVFATDPVAWPFPQPGETTALAGLVVRDAALRVDEEIARGLGAAAVESARAVEAASADAVLLTTGDGRPVAVRRQLGSGAVTVVGFDPEPARARFVLDAVAFPGLVEVLLGSRPAIERSAGGDVAPGVYEGASVVVNVAAQESEPRMLSEAEIASSVSRDASREAAAPEAVLREMERRQGGWRFALAAALGLLLVELFVASRRKFGEGET